MAPYYPHFLSVRSISPARNEFAGDGHRFGRSSLLFYTNYFSRFFFSKSHKSVAGPVTEHGGTKNLFILLFFFSGKFLAEQMH